MSYKDMCGSGEARRYIAVPLNESGWGWSDGFEMFLESGHKI